VKWLKDDIGYVHLASFFGENTAEEMMEEIRSLLDQDMKGFILDLRLKSRGAPVDFGGASGNQVFCPQEPLLFTWWIRTGNGLHTMQALETNWIFPLVVLS